LLPFKQLQIDTGIDLFKRALVLTLLLIVTFNTCWMFLFCMCSHGIALED